MATLADVKFRNTAELKNFRHTWEITQLKFPKAVSAFFRLATAAGSQQAEVAKGIIENHPEYEHFDANNRVSYKVINDALLEAYKQLTSPDAILKAMRKYTGTGMHGFVSSDQGLGWDIVRLIAGHGGYSDLYQHIWTVYHHSPASGNFRPERFVQIELSGYYVHLRGQYRDVRELVKKVDLLKDLPKDWLQNSRY